MINFVLATGMILIVLVSITIFLVWALHEHLAARKYRYLIRLHRQLGPQMPIHKVGPQWKFTYREKGKIKTATVSGATEAEALKEFVSSHSIAYKNITSSEQI